MAVPTVTIEIAPGSKASDTMPAWSDITTDLYGQRRLQNFQYQRGKQYELDTQQPGVATFLLGNNDRALDLDYTRGPFYGRLRRNVQLRFRATAGGVTYPLFRGLTPRMRFTYEGPKVARVEYGCVDRLSLLSGPLITADFAEELSGSRITRVLSAAGWPTTTVPSGWTLGTDALGVSTILGATLPLNAIDAGKATMAMATVTGQDALTYLLEIADSEPGLLFVDGTGEVVFLDRSRFSPTPPAAMLTLTDNRAAADSTHVYYDQSVTFTEDISRVANDVTVQAENGTQFETSDPSQIDYDGRVTLNRKTHLRDDTADGWQLAGWLLASQKNPASRAESVQVPLATVTAQQAILGLELGDRVTMLRTPSGPTTETVTRDLIVEGIIMDGNPNLWTATLQLVPLYTFTPWTLDTSLLGSTAELAFA